MTNINNKNKVCKGLNPVYVQLVNVKMSNNVVGVV